jgi:hypothetical protein
MTIEAIKEADVAINDWWFTESITVRAAAVFDFVVAINDATSWSIFITGVHGKIEWHFLNISL